MEEWRGEFYKRATQTCGVVHKSLKFGGTDGCSCPGHVLVLLYFGNEDRYVMKEGRERETR